MSNTLTQTDIYGLAINVGLTPARAKIAAAIAMAESGGNDAARNSSSSATGLWQIMWSVWASTLQKDGIAQTQTDLDNPLANAKAMALISKKGGNFSPWVTYTNGSYQKYLGKNVTGGVQVPGSIKSIASGVEGAAGLVSGATEALVHATAWLTDSKNWLRVMYVGGGVLLAVVGVVMIAAESGPGKAAVKTAGTAAKVAAL